MSVEEVSSSFLGGEPIPYIGLVLIDPKSSLFISEEGLILYLSVTHGIMTRNLQQSLKL